MSTPRFPYDALTQAIHDRIKDASASPKLFVLALPEENPPFPYRVISQVASTEDSTKREGNWSVDVSIEYYALGNGAADVTRLMQSDLRLLTGQKLILPDNFRLDQPPEINGTPGITIVVDQLNQQCQFGAYTLRFEVVDTHLG